MRPELLGEVLAALLEAFHFLCPFQFADCDSEPF
jgi:hypothetical protein